MAAALRFSTRKVYGRSLLQQAMAAVKEEQQRLIPGAGGLMSFLRSFSSAGAPNNRKRALGHKSRQKFPLAKPIVDVESSISNKEPANLRAQVEEKKKELLHLLVQLKFGIESETGGEKPNLKDERILDELSPFRELKELGIVDTYGDEASECGSWEQDDLQSIIHKFF